LWSWSKRARERERELERELEREGERGREREREKESTLSDESGPLVRIFTGMLGVLHEARTIKERASEVTWHMFI